MPVEDVLDWWPFAALACLLVPSAIYDARRGVIPKFLTYPALAVGLIGHTLAGGLSGGPGAMQLGLMGSILGFTMGFGPMLAVFLTGGIGGGDVKLMAAVGALTGWRFTLEALFLGLLVAVGMALVILIRHRMAMQTLGRLARWFWIVLSLGKPGDPSTAQSPRLPFGVALSVGAALALAETAWRGLQAAKLVGV